MRWQIASPIDEIEFLVFSDVLKHVLNGPNWTVTVTIVAPVASSRRVCGSSALLLVRNARIAATQRLITVGQSSRLILEIDVNIAQMQYAQFGRVWLLIQTQKKERYTDQKFNE